MILHCRIKGFFYKTKCISHLQKPFLRILLFKIENVEKKNWILSMKVVFISDIVWYVLFLDFNIKKTISYNKTLSLRILYGDTPVSVEHLIAILTSQCFQIPLTPRMFPIWGFVGGIFAWKAQLNMGRVLSILSY